MKRDVTIEFDDGKQVTLDGLDPEAWELMQETAINRGVLTHIARMDSGITVIDFAKVRITQSFERQPND